MPVLLLVAYAILVHLSVIQQAPLLQWLALVVLCAIPQAAALRAGRPRNWLLLAALAAGLFVLARMGGGIYLLFLPPVVWPAMLLAVFATSLRRGEVPLVTRMARIARGGVLPDELLVYTRRVTWLWVWTLAGLALTAVLLALFAPLSLWSAWTNFASYAVIGGMILLEYAYRRLRFRHLPHQGLRTYLRSLVRTDYRAV